MPKYRAYILGADNHYRSSEIIDASEDDAAIKAAREYCIGHGVELWLLDRKVAVLPPKSSGF